MGTRRTSTPQPGAGRARAVAGFYLALALAGFFWHATTQDTNDVWRIDPDQGMATLAWTPLVGIGIGLGIVGLFRALEGRMAWLPELHREFRGIFSRPGRVELAMLAVASSLGEELFFRGAMLDTWGPWVSSAVFAALHIPPRLALWPWTLSSFAVGLVLAGLTLATGNLGAAVAAHFVINFQNLSYITRRAPGIAVRGPVRPAPAD